MDAPVSPACRSEALGAPDLRMPHGTVRLRPPTEGRGFRAESARGEAMRAAVEGR